MFYEKIVAYCESNDMSISEFEKRCGIGNGVVGRWRNNKSSPSIRTLKKIESTLGVSIKYLLGDPD